MIQRNTIKKILKWTQDQSSNKRELQKKLKKANEDAAELRAEFQKEREDYWELFQRHHKLMSANIDKIRDERDFVQKLLLVNLLGCKFDGP